MVISGILEVEGGMFVQRVTEFWSMFKAAGCADPLDAHF